MGDPAGGVGPMAGGVSLWRACAVSLAVTLSSAASDGSLRATIQFDQVGDEIGLGAEVDWMQDAGGGRRWFGGASAFTLGDSDWGFLKAGLVQRIGAGTTGSGELQLGRGETDGEEFDYRIARGEIATPLYGPLSVIGSLQWVDVDSMRGWIAGAGAHWKVGTVTAIAIQSFGAISSDLDSEWLSARVDYTGREYRFLAGASYGRERPDRLIPESSLNDTLEVFAGGEASRRRSPLFVLRLSETGAVTRYTLMMSWRLRP